METPRERRILVVDDEEYVRSALVALLGREGYTVETAESGEEGLQLLRDRPFQLVISDIAMEAFAIESVALRARKLAASD